MRKFKLTVHHYRDKLEKEFGFADPEMVKRYAIARQEHKADKQDFNLFTNDPNCKNCRKKKRA